jgi:hypothetical protein
MKKRVVLLFWQLYRTRKRGTFALKKYDTFGNGMESERFARLAKSKKTGQREANNISELPKKQNGEDEIKDRLQDGHTVRDRNSAGRKQQAACQPLVLSRL